MKPRASGEKKTSSCPGVTRRSFLVDTGMGFTGLALGAMLFRDRLAGAGATPGAQPSAQTGPPPRARSVIWILLCGGVSHLESLDPKPALNRYAGKSIEDTPYKDALDPKKVQQILVDVNPAHGGRKVIFPLQ